MGEGECEPLPEELPKKSRHRKKHLYNTILQQMEFYFSDSNLTKDRFLSQLLRENPYVDIEIFLNFNKIRKLNCSVEDIQKAIRKSDIIELSEDGLKILRKKPVKLKENVDSCTIYIENIKADATHDTLSPIFSDFGNVVYVSIPKYKHNKANKGFAFIEYETEEQANEAILFFESIGCKISSEKNPGQLQSIITFEGDESNKWGKINQFNKGEEMVDSSEKEKKLSSGDITENIKLKTDGEVPNSTCSEAIEEIDSLENSSKRKPSSEDITKNKKSKTDDEVSNGKGSEAIKEVDSSENSKKSKISSEDITENKKMSTNEVPNDKSSDAIEEIDSLKNSKKRKLSSEEITENKKLKTDDDGKCSDAIEEIDGKKKKNKKEKRKNFIKDLGMQVLSKREWKKLRNRYLELQRKKMKEFKQYLNRQKFSQKSSDKKKNQQEEKDNNDAEAIVEEVKKLSYVPGVIVKLKLPEPCMDVKKLKNEIKSVSPEVKFVDIPLPAGSEEVFIRFSTSNAANDFCTKEFNGERVVIEEDEEKNYWEKIENDRIVKFQKVAKKQRGREKLLKKAEKESAKHLRFDESDL